MKYDIKSLTLDEKLHLLTGKDEELVKNLDYSKYIMAAKIAKGMAGKIPFKQLPFLQKRNVFIMIRESISAYILNELTEKEENK